MTKKKSKAPAREEGTDEGAPQRKTGKKKLISAGAGALLLAAGGGGAYWFFAARHLPPEVAKTTPKPVAFVDIREMVVNLAPEPNQDKARLLKFRVSLEVKDGKVASEIQPLLPRVEDMFQVFVRELRVSDLEGSTGVYRLREELLRRVNVALYPSKVEAVLFKDIVLQ